MSTEEKAMDAQNNDTAALQAGDATDTENMLDNESTTGGNQGQSSENTDSDSENGSVEAKVPQFSNLNDTAKSMTPASMSRFLDVSVQVSAELGSIKMPIGDVLQLSEGSVIELNRNLSEPVNLVAQGVQIAKGEVVVIDDCFAIRIREIESNEGY